MAVGPPFPHPSSLVLDPGLNLIVKEGFWLSCASATGTICSSRGRRSDSPQLPVLSRYLFKLRQGYSRHLLHGPDAAVCLSGIST